MAPGSPTARTSRSMATTRKFFLTNPFHRYKCNRHHRNDKRSLRDSHCYAKLQVSYDFLRYRLCFNSPKAMDKNPNNIWERHNCLQLLGKHVTSFVAHHDEETLELLPEYCRDEDSEEMRAFRTAEEKKAYLVKTMRQ